MSEKNASMPTVRVFAILAIFLGLTLWCVVDPMLFSAPSPFTFLGLGLILIGVLGWRLEDLRVWVRWLIGVLWYSVGLGTFTLAYADELPEFSMLSLVLSVVWILFGGLVFIGHRRIFWLAVVWAVLSLGGSVTGLLMGDPERQASATIRSLLHAAVLLGLLYSRRTFFRTSPAHPSESPNQ